MHPHGSSEKDLSSRRFFIRRMDTSGYVKPAEVPVSRFPLIAFIYVTSGEVLVESEGTPFLCQAGHLQLGSRMLPFLKPMLASASYMARMTVGDV